MATKTFQDVSDINELGSMIMDLLALPALLALSYTSKTMHHQANQYLRRKLTLILSSFGINANQMIEHLRLTDALIVGSMALKAVASAALPISSCHLDILVPMHRLSVLNNWITIGCQYARNLNAPVETELQLQVRNRRSFVRHIHGQRKTINLYSVRTRGDTYKMLFSLSNTAWMNAISGWGLFTLYRSLLSEGKAALNHLDNTFAIRRFSPGRRTRLFRAAVISQIRTEMHGFIFIPPSPLSHSNYQCRCINKSACPQVIRSTNDSMCSIMRIYSDAEWTSLQSPTRVIPISNPRLPTIIWRLADMPNGSPGFSIKLTDSLVDFLVSEPHGLALREPSHLISKK
jgi:hypothetical protein